MSEEGWDAEMISYPHVFELDGRTYMAYLGNQVGRHGFGLARARRPAGLGRRTCSGENSASIFDPTQHRLPNGCVQFAQSPQALVFDDFVRVYFSTRAVDGEASTSATSPSSISTSRCATIVARVATSR